jgi:hypothetical protein
MDITDLRGVSEAQRAALIALGAIEQQGLWTKSSTFS